MKNRLLFYLSVITLSLLILTFIGLSIDLFIFPFIQGKFRENIKMPDLRGLDSLKAVELIKNKGLNIGKIEKQHNEDLPKHYIFYQKPDPGHIVKPDRRVTFYISLGKKMIEIPDLRELSPAQANDTLQNLGLRLGEIKEIYSSNKTPGKIIKSEPPHGSNIEKGKSVNITIVQSSLSGKTYVPDFQNKSLENAKQMVKESHLKLRRVIYTNKNDLLPGTVVEQSIKAGTMVEINTYIDFIVTK